MFQCLPGLYIALFDKVPEEEEEAKYHPLTRFALMALARKNCLIHSTQKSLRAAAFRVFVQVSPSLSDRRSGYRIWPFFSPSPTIFNLHNAQVVWSGCVSDSGYKSVVINTKVS